MDILLLGSHRGGSEYTISQVIRLHVQSPATRWILALFRNKLYLNLLNIIFNISI